MKVTKKSLLILSGALIGCILLTILITFAGRETVETEEQEATYFFANYASADSLMAASVENESGTAVFAMINGQFLVSTEYDVGANASNIYSFFNSVYRLPLDQLLEDASAQDEQYGLTNPQATVMIEDVDEDGFIFLIGAETPGGDGYYTCLSGDERVFIMSDTYAELFLKDVDQFYDLSLFPSLSDGGIGNLSSIEVSAAGDTVYKLEQVSYQAESDLAYFALTVPGRILLGSSQFDNQVQASLEAFSGTNLITETDDLSAYGFSDDSRKLTLTYEDGSEYSVLIGNEENGVVYVMSEETGTVVTVPVSEAEFIEESAADVLGSKLISLNINTITEIRINDTLFELSGSGSDFAVTRNGSDIDMTEFQNTVYSALSSISVQGELTEDTASGEPILTLEIQTNIEDETISLAFYALDSRRCAIAVDGNTAFWCNTVVVDALLSAAG